MEKKKKLNSDKALNSKNKEKKENKKVVINKNIKSEKKVKKENIFKTISKYFKGVFKEIKRIRWTNGKDLFKYSLATVVFVLFFGIYFYGIDWIALIIRSLVK